MAAERNGTDNGVDDADTSSDDTYDDTHHIMPQLHKGTNGSDDIDAKRNRFPYSIVWGALPVLTYVCLSLSFSLCLSVALSLSLSLSLSL